MYRSDIVTDSAPVEMSWAERAAERSPVVRRSRARGVEQAKSTVEAAQRLIAVKGSAFTTQELVKEAGIALKTFYRYFEGKDQLILAVLEHMVNESCVRFQHGSADLDDPLARLRFYVTSVVSELASDDHDSANARFLAAEHLRLQSVYPERVAQASKAFADLLQGEIQAAMDAGLLRPSDPGHAAWLVTQLVRSVFYYYAFVTPDEPHQNIGDRLWGFCLGGLGGTPEST